MLALAIPTLTRFDLLESCIASALAGTVPPDYVLVVDNSGGRCPPLTNARLVLGRQPQSVAQAWNDAAAQIGGDLIVANDDIVFAPDTIQLLLEEAERNPRAGIVSAIEGQRFSLFWLRYAAYTAVGPFDEQFSPAYFEDNDYHRRLTLAGWESPVAPSAVMHAASSTMRAIPLAERETHHQQFRANRMRYLRKWGGLPHEEVYITPYGTGHV